MDQSVHTTPLIRPQWGRALFLGALGLTVASIITMLVAAPDGVIASSDSTAATPALWTLLLPSAAGIVLTLLLPRHPEPLPAQAVDRGRLIVSTLGLLGLLLVFTVGTGLVPWRNEDYILAKAVLLMALPGLLVLTVRRAVRIHRGSGAWRWWAPAVVVVVWFLLAELAPWNPIYDPGDVDPTFLIIAATATALTASVGEELFFRRWLQTRLEAGLGVWAGIGVTSVLFGLMHLGSHGTGQIWLDVAQVIAVQGTFGWFVGVLWWRYRNLTMVILVHLLNNGWGVLVHLARG